MIQATIPGYKHLELVHLILDVNGTLALDGALLPGVARRITELSDQIQVSLLTANTFGRGAAIAAELGITWEQLAPGREAEQKRDRVLTLGAEGVAAIGNGYNDALMLESAALGIAVVGPEGASSEALRCADLVTSSICDALDLLLFPNRLVAGLRR